MQYDKNDYTVTVNAHGNEYTATDGEKPLGKLALDDIEQKKIVQVDNVLVPFHAISCAVIEKTTESVEKADSHCFGGKDECAIVGKAIVGTSVVCG